MMEIKPITLATASQLLNFAGRSEVARLVAGEQLEGAVACTTFWHAPATWSPIWQTRLGRARPLSCSVPSRFPTLPSAVAGTVHRAESEPARQMAQGNPQFHREQLAGCGPSREVVPRESGGCAVLCDNLLDLVREVALDANRDFILRLSSFSLPLKTQDGGKAWNEKAEQMRQAFPGLAEKALEIDGRTLDAHEERKDAFACAVNELLPHFDLLVLDEGQNLKQGFNRARARPATGCWPMCLERRRDRTVVDSNAASTVRSSCPPRPLTTVTQTCGISWTCWAWRTHVFRR